jgi:hypothetical protein
MAIFEWVNKLMSGNNDSLPGVVGYLGEFIKKARRIFRELGLILAKVWKEAQPLVETLGQYLLAALEAVGDALEWTNRHWEDLNEFLAPIAAAFLAIWVALQLYGAAMAIATTLTLAWEAIMLVSPIGLIALAIIGLVAAVIVAYYHIDWFRQAVDAWFTALQDAYNWITANWEPMIRGMLGPLGWLITALDTIVGAMEKVSGWINKLENAAPDWMFGAKGSTSRKVFDALAHPLWMQPFDNQAGGVKPTAGASNSVPLATPAAASTFGPGSGGALVPSTTALTLPIVVQLPDGTKLAETIQKAILQAQSVR